MRTLPTIILLLIISCKLHSQESYIGAWMITKTDYFEYDTTDKSEITLESDSLVLPEEKVIASWSPTMIPLIIKNNGELILMGKKDYKGTWELMNTGTILIKLKNEKLSAEIKNSNIWISDLNNSSSGYIIATRLPKSTLIEKPDLKNHKFQFDALSLDEYIISFLLKPRLKFTNENHSGRGKWKIKLIDDSYFLFLTLDYYSFVFYIYGKDEKGYQSILFNPAINNLDGYYEEKLLVID